MDSNKIATVFSEPAQLDKWPEGTLPKGVSFKRLIAPISVNDFVSKYLGKAPLHVKGKPSNVSQLFSLQELRGAIHTLYHDRVPPPGDLKVDFGVDARAKESNRSRFALRVSPDDLPVYLAMGGTLCASNIHLGSAKLRAFINRNREICGWTGAVGVHAYLSTHGQGFTQHFDARHICTIQIEGSKTWRYSVKPSVSYPNRNAAFTNDPFYNDETNPRTWERFGSEPDQRQMSQSVVLNPGDVLALPAGTWHAASAEGYSLALNCYFQHASLGSSLGTFIDEAMMGYEGWRAGWPAHAGSKESLPATVREYARERISELRAFVDTLHPEHPSLVDAYYAQLARREDVVGIHARTSRPLPLRKGSRLRVCSPAPIVRVEPPRDDFEGTVSLYCGNTSLTLNFEARDFVRRLVRSHDFVAAESCHWTREGEYAWSASKQILELLLDKGMVSILP